VEKRESISWVFGVIASVVAIGSAWLAYHDKFASEADVKSMGAAMLIQMKNIQRGRLKWYEDTPEEDLSPNDKVQKVILEHDIRNIDDMSKTIGLGKDEG
jgi:hypothetical protein